MPTSLVARSAGFAMNASFRPSMKFCNSLSLRPVWDSSSWTRGRAKGLMFSPSNTVVISIVFLLDDMKFGKSGICSYGE